ncbi:MAG: DNA polymerase I, partial [Alphaproteobacteria bacterium]|nr:DNA polymerase I [Alphaproteobacteria bacterium]
MQHISIIDGSGYIFRAFHALPALTRQDGTHINAVLGFANMLLKIIEENHNNMMLIAFDSARLNFRHEIYPEYKAHRPPVPPELSVQFPLIKQLVKSLNIPSIEMVGFEADDLIATYTHHAKALGWNVTILSSDKDLMQLIDDSVVMMDPIKNRRIDAASVLEKFGVGPEQIIDLQALAGDTSDNVPGVPGIGLKTAAELLKNYRTLEGILTSAHEIKQAKRRQLLIDYAEQAKLSQNLVRLKHDVPLEKSLEDLKNYQITWPSFLDFLKENQFRSILSRLERNHIIPSISTSIEISESEVLPKTSQPVYELVQTIDQLKGWIEKIINKGVVAFDTETTSLEPVRAELVGFSLSVDHGQACYVPVAHKNIHDVKDFFTQSSAPHHHQDFKQIPLAEAIACLKPILESSSILKIGHNIKYDIIVMAKYDIKIAPIDDSMMISYVLAAGQHGHGMDELSKLHLGHETITYDSVTGSGKNRIRFDEVDLNKAKDYAAEDADVTLQLYHYLKPQLQQNKLSTIYETIERPLIPVVARMEQTGIKIDKHVLQDLSGHFSNRLDSLAQKIYQLCGEEFNIGSPKQLGEILFDKLGLPGGKKSKLGAYAT